VGVGVILGVTLGVGVTIGVGVISGVSMTVGIGVAITVGDMAGNIVGVTVGAVVSNIAGVDTSGVISGTVGSGFDVVMTSLELPVLFLLLPISLAHCEAKSTHNIKIKIPSIFFLFLTS